MGYLIALGLLVAFSAALLSPYGRRLLATMGAIVAAIVGLIVVGYLLLPKTPPTPPPSAWDNETITLPAPPASNVQPTNAAADTSTGPASSNAAEEAQAALIRADEATGLVQWIGGKMFYCTGGPPWIPTDQIPRPDQLRRCGKADAANTNAVEATNDAAVVSSSSQLADASNASPP